MTPCATPSKYLNDVFAEDDIEVREAEELYLLKGQTQVHTRRAPDLVAEGSEVQPEQSVPATVVYGYVVARFRLNH